MIFMVRSTATRRDFRNQMVVIMNIKKMHGSCSEIIKARSNKPRGREGQERNQEGREESQRQEVCTNGTRWLEDIDSLWFRNASLRCIWGWLNRQTKTLTIKKAVPTARLWNCEIVYGDWRLFWVGNAQEREKHVDSGTVGFTIAFTAGMPP